MLTLQAAIETAMASHMRGDIDVAEAQYDQIMYQTDKPDVNLLVGYGTLLVGKQKFGLGISLLRTGLALYDKHPLAWANLGVAYKHIGRDDLSLQAYEKALALSPYMPEVLAGMGGFYINKDKAWLAEKYSRRALEIDPNLPAARMNLAVALLEQGRLEEAWPHYEGRWESLDRSMDKRPYKAPRWTGERVKTLAIHGEQGLGDEILFMSLFQKVKERAERVVIECAERLVAIFGESFGVPCYPDHASLIEAEGEPDAYIPMGSLPLVLGLPDGRPFLKRPHHHRTGKPLIGIAWRGGTMRTNLHDRTMALKDLRPLLEAVDAEFVCVQYGGADVEAEAKEMGLEIGQRDFPSLQYRIGICDLVISVCQTAVHQAGAMGVDCWTLVPRNAAWRYCGENMMPWYRSVQFFRQGEDHKWEPVIARGAKALQERYAAVAA